MRQCLLSSISTSHRLVSFIFCTPFSFSSCFYFSRSCSPFSFSFVCLLCLIVSSVRLRCREWNTLAVASEKHERANTSAVSLILGYKRLAYTHTRHCRSLHFQLTHSHSHRCYTLYRRSTAIKTRAFLLNISFFACFLRFSVRFVSFVSVDIIDSCPPSRHLLAFGPFFNIHSVDIAVCTFIRFQSGCHRLCGWLV